MTFEKYYGNDDEEVFFSFLIRTFFYLFFLLDTRAAAAGAIYYIPPPLSIGSLSAVFEDKNGQPRMTHYMCARVDRGRKNNCERTH